MSRPDEPLQLGTTRVRLASARGPEFWRTLEELAGQADFHELLKDEFPQHAAVWDEHVDRRKFLALLGASLALAGLAGCSASQAPPERIMPYVRQPEPAVQGRSLFYATAMPLAGYATGGLLVQSHLGRPTKVEGNPDHPASPLPSIAARGSRFGPSGLFAQASPLGLYDPDRSQSVRHLGVTSAWEAFQSALNQELRRRPRERLRLRILTGTLTSPSLLFAIRRVLAAFPQARWHEWEPCGSWNEREGARLAFGRDVETLYRFDRAERVLALDADFLSCGPGHLRYVRDFMDRRRVWSDEGRPNMNRLYVVESQLTGTGAKADHRVPLRPSQVVDFARAVASRLGVLVGGGERDAAFGLPAGWLDALARDLRDHPGRCVVLAGETQPPVVHALAHAMNQGLGGVGHTVLRVEPVAEMAAEREGEPRGPAGSLQSLVQAMDAGEVDALLILGGNPVYTAPADLRFAERLERVPLRVHLGLHFDETAGHCHWHLPDLHYLESWGDVRAYDGTVSIIQPLINPLYQSRPALEVLGAFTGRPEQPAHTTLRQYWRSVFERDPSVQAEQGLFARIDRGADFESWWQQSLHAGFIAGSESPPVNGPRLSADLDRLFAERPGRAQGTEVVFRPDPSVFDGRFTNNAWLMELPKPITKITWENPAYLSPRTAVSLGLAASEDEAFRANGKLVRVRQGERQVTAPAWVMPGHADGVVTLFLGFGRTAAGRVGSNLGYDAYRLRTSSALWTAGGATITPTGRTVTLATTQHHHLMENRDLVRTGRLDDYDQVRAEARRLPAPRGDRPSLYPAVPESHANKWGMTIDLSVCTGCQACVIACQSENNIPVVGREEVARGREMHWLRIDSYFTPRAPRTPLEQETYFQPLPCMHCETAPCELVCPVEATVHSDDGLNDMVYNRCVGTRYCSNNCPYKVRRFNFLQYADFETPQLHALRNPDVTVRSRGVMEKCTYCVQRIRRAQVQAQLDDRPVGAGEVQTACQSACPAGAIIFGDLNDRTSAVARTQAHELNYGLLQDLNTRPRTTYLWAMKNPNGALLALEGRGQR